MDNHETKDVKTTPTSEDKSAPLVTGVDAQRLGHHPRPYSA
jgi:hypothetical protein